MTRFAILAIVIATSTASAFADSTYSLNDKNRLIRVATPIAVTNATPKVQAATPKVQVTPAALTAQAITVRHTNDKNRPI